MDVIGPEDIPSQVIFLGVLKTDVQEVPCYLAKGLDQMKAFSSCDEFLRARSVLGPGIVFTGAAVGPRLIGANVVVPLVSVYGGKFQIGVDRDAVAVAFRAGRSITLGAGTLDLVEEANKAAACLHVPGCEPLDVFGEPSVRAFRLLVAAAKRGSPPVRAGDLMSYSPIPGQIFG